MCRHFSQLSTSKLSAPLHEAFSFLIHRRGLSILLLGTRAESLRTCFFPTHSFPSLCSPSASQRNERRCKIHFRSRFNHFLSAALQNELSNKNSSWYADRLYLRISATARIESPVHHHDNLLELKHPSLAEALLSPVQKPERVRTQTDRQWGKESPATLQHHSAFQHWGYRSVTSALPPEEEVPHSHPRSQHLPLLLLQQILRFVDSQNHGGSHRFPLVLLLPLARHLQRR